MSTDGSSRTRVLEAVRAADGPMTVDEVTAALDLHVNTVRTHLVALTEAGLLHRSSQPGAGQGRPRATYSPTPAGERVGPRNYQMLAEVLVENLLATAENPITSARTAGKAWGERLAKGGSDRRPRSPRARGIAVLADLGFSPEPHPARGPRELHLRNCPFRELVDAHQPLVCALHGGMVEGLLGLPGDPPALVPFVTPTTCVVHLVQSRES